MVCVHMCVVLRACVLLCVSVWCVWSISVYMCVCACACLCVCVCVCTILLQSAPSMPSLVLHALYKACHDCDVCMLIVLVGYTRW